MFGKRFSRALAVTTVASLVMATAAFADDIQNDVAYDVDAAADVVDLAPGGATAPVVLTVDPTNGDGKNGCNLTGSTTFTASVASSNTAVATINPSSVTFTSCGDLPTLTVTSGIAGSAVISLTETGNTTAGTFNVAPATFTVRVTATDSTPPVISYVLDPAAPDGTNGWYRGDVTLTWTVTEDESAASLVKTGCVDQNITADQAAVTYSCSATSDGGDAGPVDVTIKRDGTAPTVEYTSAAPAVTGGGPNAAGWYKSDVVATFAATDNLSGFDAAGTLTSTDTNTSTDEGTAVSVGSPAFTDHAGNTVAANAATSAAFKIDMTAPVVAVNGVTNGATYILGSVPAAGCSTTETLSGVKAATSLSSSGGPVGSITATCSAATDNADNTGSPASVTYTVIFDFAGFFRPVDNLPALNVAKAGSAIPLKFSLGGNQGLSILAAGFPTSKVSNCDVAGAPDVIEETVTAGQSSLSYDSTADQYVYVWKTDKNWAGSCRTLTVKLADGTIHQALFKLTK